MINAGLFLLRHWRGALVLAALAGAGAWHWSALREARREARASALADVRSATVARGVLADRAANEVEACYARANHRWNREAGRCEQ